MLLKDSDSGIVSKSSILGPQTGRCSGLAYLTSVGEAMFWPLAVRAIGAGLLFGGDLACIGAAVESMSKELQLDKKDTE